MLTLTYNWVFCLFAIVSALAACFCWGVASFCWPVGVCVIAELWRATFLVGAVVCIVGGAFGPFLVCFCYLPIRGWMEDWSLFSSQLLVGDAEIGEPLASVHASSKVLSGKIQSGDGESPPKGGLWVKKINGYLHRVEDRPILIIQPEQVFDDVEY